LTFLSSLLGPGGAISCGYDPTAAGAMPDGAVVADWLHAVKGPIRSVDDLAAANDTAKELVFLDLLERGYYMARRGFIALSLMVSDADLDGFVAAVKDVVAERADVLPRG
jgi:hypothetical protein